MDPSHLPLILQIKNEKKKSVDFKQSGGVPEMLKIGCVKHHSNYYLQNEKQMRSDGTLRFLFSALRQLN